MKTTTIAERIAIVTGGGSGIGFAIAEKFVKAGILTIIIGRDQKKLAAAAKELGDLCRTACQDLDQLDAIPGLIDRLVQQYGHIDILVNNAGINMKKEFTDVTDEDFERILLTNLRSVFAISREAVRVMLPLGKGHIIFDRTLVEKILSAGGIIHNKYDEDPIYHLLTEYFGDETIAGFIRPSLITSYEITDRKAVFFTSTDAAQDAMNNFYVRDAARATSAAPTYFPPANIASLNGQKYTLVDGGMFANNPALCAYAEARKTDFSVCLNNKDKKDKPTAADMIIVSLGTGSVQKSYHYDTFKHAGEIKWLEPVIDILMSGNSETVAYQLTQMYLTLEPQFQKNYYRLEPGLKEACSEMDIATKDNINKLYQAGLTYAHNNINQLQAIAKNILEND